MKKTLAIVLALVMVLSCGAAFAATGWGQSADAKTYKNFEVSLKAYEARDNGAGLSLADYKTGSAADEITGRVVIGTAVVIIVKVTVPKLENTDLETYDYANGKLNLTFGNLDVTGTITGTLAGAAPNFSAGTTFLAATPGTPSTLEPTTSKETGKYTEVTADEEYNIFVAVNTAAKTEVTYAIVGQAKKTAECPVTATFTMGQDVDAPTKVKFVNGDDIFTAWFEATAGTKSNLAGTASATHASLVIAKMDAAGTTPEYGLYFDVNGSNKLSNMVFHYDDKNYTVDSCGRDGGILFNDGASGDICSHNQEVLVGSMEKAFNKILNALGWDYSRGSADFGYATAKDVNGLANQVKVAAGYTFNECTELAVVDIPQTGSFAYGFAVVAMAIVAGAVVAIRKIRA